MPTSLAEHADALWLFLALAGGGLVWFISHWMGAHDKARAAHTQSIAAHETSLRVVEVSVEALRTSVALFRDDFQRLMTKIEKHVDEEPHYWRDSAVQQSEILAQLAALKQELKDHICNYSKESKQ